MVEGQKVGPLMRGTRCGMSILRNGDVACLWRLFSLMSHVCFEKWRCPMSLYFYLPLPPCRVSLSPMSHVKFKKCSCRPVDSRGQWPWQWHKTATSSCRHTPHTPPTSQPPPSSHTACLLLPEILESRKNGHGLGFCRCAT